MNRRMLWVSVFALGISLIVSDSLIAQQRGNQRGRQGGQRGPGGPGGFGRSRSGGGPLSLLGNEAIQQELGLSATQASDVKKLVEVYREDQRAARGNFDFRSLRDLSEDERRKKFEELRKQGEETQKKLNAKYEPKIADLLDPPQAERLEQISLQLKGVRALQEKDTAQALGLKQDQQDKIASINQAYGEKMREMFSGGGRGERGGDRGNRGERGGDRGNRGERGGDRGGFQERFAQMREMGEKRDKDVLAVLTDAQKKMFEEMKGKPVDREKLFGGRGRGGDSGRGRGGDRGGRPRGERPST